MTTLEQNWITVKAFFQDKFGRVPDMEGILFLIGINEVGFPADRNFKKEEKQDLMHVAMCTLLSMDGFYEFSHQDADGWLHFTEKMKFPELSVTDQEEYLKEKVIQYFADTITF